LSVTSAPTDRVNWQKIVANYQNPDIRRSTWQIINSFVPYIILWYLLYRSISISIFLTIPLAILAAGFMMRIFIIFHDCGHGSFFKSQSANHFWGIISGILTFTPYFQWRHEHAIHHASAGDLDRRGMGDVWTLTTQEYIEMKPLARLGYRVFRFPLVTFGLGPFWMFMIQHRLVRKGASKRERNNVWATNLTLLVMGIGLSFLMGWQSYVLIQGLILFIGGGLGVFLFYVQHQFEEVYWEHHNEWDYYSAAIEGSSYYKMPKIFQWFTGNIGIHHVHHLSPRIPNYKLQAAQDENEIFQQVPPLTFRESMKALYCHLWDENQRTLIGFRAAHKLYIKQRQTVQAS
jgi:omega-6 fatty acid desaturase (delta-12 desaturase)